MKFTHVRNSIFLILLAAVFYSCSSSNSTVVVVDDEPETGEVGRQETTTLDAEFTELTVGLIDTVTNFDPLFAENLSSQRTISLIYNGLYTLDRDGNPVPSLVSSLEISEDSLEYIFTLKEDKYFHNSSVFTAGVGRRVAAPDVKNAFERTARSTVPEKAAQLLMGVAGFENYFLEQRSVYDQKNRVLNEVNGIQVLDSQTVAFILKEKDSDFLKKLASPYLLVYPQESVRSNNHGLSNNPIGTGPYYLNRIEQNGRIVLSRNDQRARGEPLSSLVNRINLIYAPDENQLFREFTTGQTDWIPEISPNISNQVINEDGNLQDSYKENFNLTQNSAERIAALYLNERTTVNQDWLINRFAYLTNEDFNARGDLTLNVDNFEITEDVSPHEQYFASFTDDVLTKKLLTELHNIIFIPESSLVLFDIRVPTRQTSMYSRNSDSIQISLDPLEDGYFLKIDTPILGLYKDRVTGVEPTAVPWLLHIENIRIRNSE